MLLALITITYLLIRIITMLSHVFRDLYLQVIVLLKVLQQMLVPLSDVLRVIISPLEISVLPIQLEFINALFMIQLVLSVPLVRLDIIWIQLETVLSLLL